MVYLKETSQRRIIIGDVHGHYDGLMTLLEAIAPDTSDQVYFLGDLIDRGPHSAQVVDFVEQSSYQCLLGNHEQMLLNALARGHSSHMQQAWLYNGGQATVNSYKEAIPQEHLEWMNNLPTHLDLGDIWLAHAGIDPRIELEKQTADQLCWVRGEFHSIPQPYFADKLIIIGHSITFTLPGVAPGKLAQGQGWLDIDTGAYHPKSGWLTGLDITNHLVYQVNIFNRCVRTLPLEEAVTRVDPAQVLMRR
ncbi:MAG: serine/threonine protein phosphatase [Gloeocapsa sp. UFS-A4-WI-NPMV-4B04]|jgi:serine/threonine protein phosphatase 1|nr:serine/threonine protein phosphatase [Gloeocapsa sp. UFS-A4-WI-NPMV-4B04]